MQSRPNTPNVLANGMIIRRNSLSPKLLRKEELLNGELEDLSINDAAVERQQLIDIPTEQKPTPRRRRLCDVVIAMLVLLVAESARGIVLPTLAPYVEELGGDSVILGYAVAAFSVGRFASTIGLGYLSTRLSYKTVLAGSVLCCIIGNILYCGGSVTGVYVMLVSRFITGFGAGTLSVVRAYVAHVTTTEERTAYMSILGAVQFLGFAITPGIGSILSYMPEFTVIVFPVDEYTYPGYFLAVGNILVFVALLLVFQNPPPLEAKPVTQNTMGEVVKPKRNRALVKAFAVFLGLNLMVRLVLGILETLGTPMYIDVRGGDKSKATEAGFVFAGMGFVGVGVLFFISYLSKYIQDFYVLETGLLVLILGNGLLIGNDVGFPRFLIGAGLIWCVGFPLAQTIIVSMFSKMLGKTPQGTWMGWIGAMGSLGRVVGPIGAGYLYDNLGQFAAMLFGAAMSAASLLLTLLILPKRRQTSL